MFILLMGSNCKINKKFAYIKIIVLFPEQNIVGRHKTILVHNRQLYSVLILVLLFE